MISIDLILGAPVIDINVADEQLDDRIDEALEVYQEYHSDATLRTYLKHQITSTDISNEYITYVYKLDIKYCYINLIFNNNNYYKIKCNLQHDYLRKNKNKTSNDWFDHYKTFLLTGSYLITDIFINMKLNDDVNLNNIYIMYNY